MEIEELKKEREAQINSIFLLMIEIAFIFALPAIVAILLGKKFDKGEVGLYTGLLLLASFIISWIITILIYRAKTRKLRETEEQIKELKK